MDIRIRGAREHNLKNLDIGFGDGLTVVTGVSGSGKTSLVFDTLYHEAQRRLLDVLLYGRGGQRLAPARVEQISGLGPAIAVGQNLLNRNPASTLATASGLHPFLRLLFTHYSERRCLQCGQPVNVLSEDEIIDQLANLSREAPLRLVVPLVQAVLGGHRTLLSLLGDQFGAERLVVDGAPYDKTALDPQQPHTIQVEMGSLAGDESTGEVRALVQDALALGAGVVWAYGEQTRVALAITRVCTACGAGLEELRATYFNQACPYCQGKGGQEAPCPHCDSTGMHPQAASARWQGLRLPELLKLSVEEALDLFIKVALPATADRLRAEILRRLQALDQVGLGYLALERAAPTLSRGESQRVRLAISLSSRLEDLLHVLDEPTVGQHSADVARFLPAFRDLPGPVVYVEHDRTAVAAADRVIDLGEGAGSQGGKVIFDGAPAELWQADTPSGRYFSLRERPFDYAGRHAQRPLGLARGPADSYLVVRGARQHNLAGIDVRIPLGRLTVISGVSGSGKSTLVEHVLIPSLEKGEPIHCDSIEGPPIRPVVVDQSPIGRNPRSNPATYTKLSELIRDVFAQATGLSKSHFSFNRPEGACPICQGLGAEEIKMRFLPSIWAPCPACEGQRFSPEVLGARVDFNGRALSVADLYALPIQEAGPLLMASPWLTPAARSSAGRILQALQDVGLGYLALGQPSPTLSGGEAQRVKLTKTLGRNRLTDQLIVLDEPSTGLHPQDLRGLLLILERLVKHGATIVVVEHNTDLIRAADWIIDLGPGAGPRGGRLLYQGPPPGLLATPDSLTGKALLEEDVLLPRQPACDQLSARPERIAIRNARANNLKGIDVDLPKGALTVVTGVSGSGKSSLVGDVLQTEARRRYLESLSIYERQGLREGAQAEVDSVSGLGVTLTVAHHQAHLWSIAPQFTRRNSVGAITEISFHLAHLLSALGQRCCLTCGASMTRAEAWGCPGCGATAPIATASHFSSAHWSSSCPKCSGLGVVNIPQPEKLIIHPEKPLCAGAMYSPGYWPQSYLCKDQPIIAEIGKHYGFDPMHTPWNEMSDTAQKAFLFGDGLQYTWTYISKSTGRTRGQERSATWTWRGFYGEDSWIFDWDIHGTYVRQEACPECGGAGLRPEYLAVTLQGQNMYALSSMPLAALEALVREIPAPPAGIPLAATSLEVVKRRLRFLRQVGLGYLHLNRPTGTLSAGEAQRIQLASLLGSELTSLTILIDEPSRGMHPCELEALRSALLELRDQGNTLVVVEHDPLLIRAADHILDIGPGAGAAGGQIVAQGSLEEIIQADTVTGRWLRREQGALQLPLHCVQGSGLETPRSLSVVEMTTSSGFRTRSATRFGGEELLGLKERRTPQGWMRILGARANNLKGEEAAIPLGVFTGVCGVSGSGKSTLLIDTLGRALVKKLHSSSFAQEPVEPGAHDAIENPPGRAFLVDQARRGIHSPASYLGLESPILKIFMNSDDAQALGLGQEDFKAGCSACRGLGSIRIEMDFLPDEWVACETCQGTGYRREAWQARVKGLALPEINALTLEQVAGLFPDEPSLASPLQVVQEVGLGYLVWKQPAYTLSGGEVQRLKIAKELIKKTKEPTLYILDEPTVGLHLEDVARLVQVLERLVEGGHTVVAVEHHLHLLAACDWLIELGPEGGPQGGYIIATGVPEEVMRGNTPTAPYLRQLLDIPNKFGSPGA